MTRPLSAPVPPAAGGLWRWSRRVGLLLAALVAGFLALVIHPQPLFAYSLQRGNLVLHARAPFPAQAVPIADEVLRRVSRSPLYDRAHTHDVFLCDTPALYGLFALWGYRSGGVTHTQFTGNAFIRPFNIERNVVFGRMGQVKQAERSLAYFIAHEVTHAMSAHHFGRRPFARLAAFQTEGYADYVAFAREVDLARGRAALLADAPEMSPRRSGLYARYELLVAYLLRHRGLSVDQLLEQPMSQKAVERELVDATDL
ncbi:MAG TPA: hypothetical protein VNO55_16830 [Polyangia bacterium]|nr:hypothetical protein [Polyangia bacterium]